MIFLIEENLSVYECIHHDYNNNILRVANRRTYLHWSVQTNKNDFKIKIRD